MAQRTGRPKSDNPKDVTIRCRIDKELNKKIEEYCSENSTTKSEVIVKGIKMVIEKK